MKTKIILKLKNLIKTSENIETSENIPSGVSIESASYIESNGMNENDISQEFSSSNDEEYTPKLFSEDQNYQAEGNEDGSKQESTYSDIRTII